jgi:hypothetical protein
VNTKTNFRVISSIASRCQLQKSTQVKKRRNIGLIDNILISDYRISNDVMLPQYSKDRRISAW